MQTGTFYLLSVPSGPQKSSLKRGETSLMYKGGTLRHPWCWTRHFFKRQTALRWPGESILTGALPLCGLYHSATGGGLLADLPSMTCFCIKCDHKGIIQGGSHGASRVKNIVGVELACCLHRCLDIRIVTFTLAPHLRYLTQRIQKVLSIFEWEPQSLIRC